MPIYNKLVRDKIPEIIAQSGKACRVRSLSPDEIGPMLRAKLQEELAEYLGALTDAEATEELADVLEVIFALGTVHGVGPERLLALQQEKRDARGGFAEGLFLIDVDD